MNIAMIMSGGVGKRFGTLLPKQYNLINGKPVIDYVIDACRQSKLTDKIVVVCDPQCVQFSKELSADDIDIASNGTERCYSLDNGLRFIRENYNCDNVCILDAVAPFVYPELIDEYFSKLHDYDCVITCQRITGEIGNYDYDIMDRNQYYITQSPEAFRFNLLIENFDPEFNSSELANQLPRKAKRYLNFDFKNNLKITYDFELKYASYMIQYFREVYKRNVKIYEKDDFITEGLKSFLLRTQPNETSSWLKHVADNYQRLADKWKINSFIPNQNSRFGLVLLAESQEYGAVIIKFIPPFIHRYATEKACYMSLSDAYMCRMIDYDDSSNALLLEQVKPGIYARFEDNLALTKFWNKVFNADRLTGCEFSSDYFSELCDKFSNVGNVGAFKNQIEYCLQKSITLYEKYFKKAPCCLIHGDLHEFNIIKSQNEYVAIDPIGFAAPIEFEAVRFIRNDVLRNSEFGMQQRFELLLQYFSKWLSPEKLAIAEFIDLSFTTYNSVFENESNTQTEKMIFFIKIIDDYIENLIKEK